LQPALVVVFILLVRVPPAEDSPNAMMLRAKRAQELINELRVGLTLDKEVQLRIVVSNPLVFSVEPLDSSKKRYALSMELGFLMMLDDDELRAALAHELGHIWIFNHHPYLQTERLANDIGRRVVKREAFERVYGKLWKYEGTTGTDIDQLLGPPSAQPGASPQ
jgi:hypothetical protein